ncbi:MAG TPA: SRPBCC family protein [Solirubrobacteraceae bacterium]|nr:SRPBCC family protein [Solirubrobacteraceae bacterium]
MISLSNTIEIAAPPSSVWRFFADLDRRYADWHPEHLRWRTLRGEPLRPGTVWFADEWIGPMRISGRFFVIEARPEKFFTYRLGLPASIIRAGGSFRLAGTEDGRCVLTEETHFGFSAPIIGPLLDIILHRTLPIDEFRRHLREEGENLAHMLGAGQTPVTAHPRS